MPDNKISDLIEEDYLNAEAQVIGLVREARPELDLRLGTALRDLVIRTMCQIAAVEAADIDDLRAEMSFKLLSENPDLASDDVVESLASNYAITRQEGTAASGYVVLYLRSVDQVSLPNSYLIARLDLTYVTEQQWTLTTEPTEANELKISTDVSGRPFAIVPFVASTIGSSSNVRADEAFEIVDLSVPQITGAVAYGDFQGGQDKESVDALLIRISESISHRELTSENAISTRLKNEFSEIVNVSIAGFGDEEMLRDKHNVFGIAVGSRVDVYLKTFSEPTKRTITKVATKVSDGVYTFDLTPDEVGVIYFVSGVTSPDSLITAENDDQAGPILGSYDFTEERKLYIPGSVAHDISTDDEQKIIETSYTAYQSRTIVVTGIAAINGVYPDTAELRVDVYVAPRVDAIQDFLDDDAVRNREADILAKGAVPAFVSMLIPVYRRSSASIDTDAMRIAIADYINSKAFGEDLTLSQISSILHGYDILKVGTEDPDLSLTAMIKAADGSILTISGTELSISKVASPELQVTPRTSTFVADLSDIFIKEIIV